MTPHAELVAAWKTWDDECLRRAIYKGKNAEGRDQWRTNNGLPSDASTLRMEAACKAVAADLSLTTTELRLVLSALRRVGCSHEVALSRCVEMFTVVAA